MPLDPREWTMAISMAVVRRRSGYRVDQHPMLRGNDGLTVQAPIWMITGDTPGQLEGLARERLEGVIRSAESIQGQEPSTGPEPVNTVTYEHPTPHAQTEGYVRRSQPFSQRMGLVDPSPMELWRD